jgi:Arc/MetJ family transcription regulator
MRTNVTIDDSLLAHARSLSGLREDGQLLKAALHALIKNECAQRLASLVGSQRAGKFGACRPDFDL